MTLLASRAVEPDPPNMEAVIARINALDAKWTRNFANQGRRIAANRQVLDRHDKRLQELHPLTQEQTEALADLTGRRVARAFMGGVLKTWRGRAVTLLTFVALLITIVGGVVEIARNLPAH